MPGLEPPNIPTPCRAKVAHTVNADDAVFTGSFACTDDDSRKRRGALSFAAHCAVS